MINQNPTHHLERILVDEREAARLLSISPKNMFALAAADEIRSLCIGSRSKRYDVEDLRAHVESQKEEKGGDADE